MKIAIISDSHDNWPNIEKAIKYLNKNKITTIIHCGDVCAPGVLREMLKLFNGQIHLVAGNVDGDIEGFKKLEKDNPEKLKFYGQTGLLDLKIKNLKLKIVFCHDPFVAKKMAASGKYDFVFHGHTHKPWQEKIGSTEIYNPGTLAGLFNKATFAIFDTQTKKAQLLLLEKI